MSTDFSLKSFGLWFLAGMGFHLGWAVISLIIYLLAQAMHTDAATHF